MSWLASLYTDSSMCHIEIAYLRADNNAYKILSPSSTNMYVYELATVEEAQR